MKQSFPIIRLILAAAMVLFVVSCDIRGCGSEDDNNDGDDATIYHTLTITVQGYGRTAPEAGTYTYPQGTSVSITAAADEGATFTGWSGSAVGTANTITVTMNGGQTLTANFAVVDNGNDAGDNDGNAGYDDSAYDLPDHCSDQCTNAEPVYPTILEDGGLGNITTYQTSASIGGACNYGVTDVMYYAAINVNAGHDDYMGQWQGGAICGQCAEVTAVTSQGLKKTVVRILDRCQDEYCGIDLGGAAPAEVMVDNTGRYEGSWRFVSCEGHPEVSDGPPSLDVFSGCGPGWSRVHVRNGFWPVSAISWEDTDSSVHGVFPFSDNPENTYEVPVDKMFKAIKAVLITVYFVDGSTATVTLSPEQLYTSYASYPLDLDN